VIGRAELTIGDFARRSRLPVSTLRYYDKIGLLRLAAVDPGTGYRRYTIDQLPAAALISQLRSLGIAPDSIAHVLEGGFEASAALTRERQRIAVQIERDRERLRGLDELLAERPPHAYEVQTVDLAGGEVAALPFLLPAAELEAGVTRAIASLRSALRRAGTERSGAWGATFPLDIADDVSGLVFAPVVGTPHAAIETAWLPAGRAISVAHHGVPARLPLAYGAAFAALDELGAAATGPVIEDYPTLDDPDAPAALIRVSVPFHGVDDKQPGR
jgi:DNA-binding transcriptional MerR regulator